MLRRLKYPVAYYDMMPMFGRSIPTLCQIYIFMVDLIYNNWNQTIYFAKHIDRTRLMHYATAIHNKGAPTTNVYGFSDGTKVETCRPISNVAEGLNLWSERSVECMFELRYKTLADRFDRCKNTQATKEAYITLACELSLQMGTPFDASQVQNKLHDLRKKWTRPKHKATGNGDLVKTKPQYYDILNKYWGSKEGLSRTSLLSTDVEALETNDDNPDRDCDEQNGTYALELYI
ncbi:hypothetical protein Ae201684_002858 [Aphanomyces euteiches]|uniref:Myb/SANT-like DNA-binding domain-containing protein n=1 Tax=Aphanomyces euteiches TaxID=100861 RepID=A0A6G0XPE3_9STRA|nr:hypothetical protein Ae201684_002858 [Aphanomyces euteiches]